MVGRVAVMTSDRRPCAAAISSRNRVPRWLRYTLCVCVYFTVSTLGIGKLLVCLEN